MRLCFPLNLTYLFSLYFLLTHHILVWTMNFLPQFLLTKIYQIYLIQPLYHHLTLYLFTSYLLPHLFLPSTPLYHHTFLLIMFPYLQPLNYPMCLPLPYVILHDCLSLQLGCKIMITLLIRLLLLHFIQVNILLIILFLIIIYLFILFLFLLPFPTYLNPVIMLRQLRIING